MIVTAMALSIRWGDSWSLCKREVHSLYLWIITRLPALSLFTVTSRLFTYSAVQNTTRALANIFIRSDLDLSRILSDASYRYSDWTLSAPDKWNAYKFCTIHPQSTLRQCVLSGYYSATVTLSSWRYSSLLTHYLGRLAKQHQQYTLPAIGEDSLRLLWEHSWPGNISEFIAVLENAYFRGTHQELAILLADEVKPDTVAPLDEAIRQHIQRALHQTREKFPAQVERRSSLVLTAIRYTAKWKN